MNAPSPVAELPIRLVTYRGGLFDTVPVPGQTTWGQLVTALSTRRVMPGEKQQVPGWSPIAVHEGMTRSLAAVETVYALVLDYDGTATLEQAREAWAPWCHVGHTTWQGAPRCRVVVPLAQPCPAALWVGVYGWAQARDPRIDQKTKDASRFWYQPATNGPADPFASWVHEGPALELDYARLMKPKPKLPPLERTSGAGARRCAVRRLDHPDARMRAAEYLHVAVNANGNAKGARCPACGRFSVWWHVEESGPAICNHRKTCGWMGSLAKVLDLADGRVAA